MKANLRSRRVAGSNGKVNKNAFLQAVAEQVDMPVADVKKVWDAVVDGALHVLCSGRDLSMAGFGMFGLRVHKGHPIQFDQTPETRIKDYIVLRFTPSDVFMDEVRAKAVIPDGGRDEEARDGRKG